MTIGLWHWDTSGTHQESLRNSRQGLAINNLKSQVSRAFDVIVAHFNTGFPLHVSYASVEGLGRSHQVHHFLLKETTTMCERNFTAVQVTSLLCLGEPRVDPAAIPHKTPDACKTRPQTKAPRAGGINGVKKVVSSQSHTPSGLLYA